MPVGGVYVFIKPPWRKKKNEFVPYSSDKIVFIFRLITDMHYPNISLSLSTRINLYLKICCPTSAFDITSVIVFMTQASGNCQFFFFLRCLK